MKTDAGQYTIRFGSREIIFSLLRNGRKRLKIVVTPELNVQVFAPSTETDDQVLTAVFQKAHWITQKLDKLASYHPLPMPKQYISGETLAYLGRQYRLKIVKGKREPAKLAGGYIEVPIEKQPDRTAVRSAVEAWYRMRANVIFNQYLNKCQAITRRHSIPEPKLMIRTMKRRWGSCSPAGRITLNLKLVQVPVHCIEYVIMHELCHLKHDNHSNAFFSLLLRCMPDWQKRKAEIDRFRLS